MFWVTRKTDWRLHTCFGKSSFTWIVSRLIKKLKRQWIQGEIMLNPELAPWLDMLTLWQIQKDNNYTNFGESNANNDTITDKEERLALLWCFLQSSGRQSNIWASCINLWILVNRNNLFPKQRTNRGHRREGAWGKTICQKFCGIWVLVTGDKIRI